MTQQVGVGYDLTGLTINIPQGAVLVVVVIIIIFACDDDDDDDDDDDCCRFAGG